MYAVRMRRDADEADFREAARRCISLRISPCDVAFIDPDEPSLFPPLPEGNPAHAFNVPRPYGQLLRDAICHSASDRFALLYDTLWRIVQGQRELIANPADTTVARLNEYIRNVRRDIHKMHAFCASVPASSKGAHCSSRGSNRSITFFGGQSRSSSIVLPKWTG